MAAAAVGQVHQVGADFLGREGGVVMARAGLFQGEDLLLAFGADDQQLQVEEIAIVPFGVDGLDADVAFAFLHGDLGIEIGGIDAPQAPLRDLLPELLVLAPSPANWRPIWRGRRK